MTQPDDDGRVSSDRGDLDPLLRGSMEMRCKDGFIYFDLTGPMNRKFVEAFLKLWGDAMWTRPKDEVVLVLVRWWRSMLITPDAAALMRGALAADAPQSTCRIAWVVPSDIEGRGLFLDKWADMYEASGMQLEVFSSFGPAQARLQELQRTYRR